MKVSHAQSSTSASNGAVLPGSTACREAWTPTTTDQTEAREWSLCASDAIERLDKSYSNVIDAEGVLELLQNVKDQLSKRLPTLSPTFSTQALHAYDEDSDELSSYVRLVVAVSESASRAQLFAASEFTDDLIAECESVSAREAVVVLFDRRR